jgi:hypothetical protein
MALAANAEGGLAAKTAAPPGKTINIDMQRNMHNDRFERNLFMVSPFTLKRGYFLGRIYFTLENLKEKKQGENNVF